MRRAIWLAVLALGCADGGMSAGPGPGLVFDGGSTRDALPTRDGGGADAGRDAQVSVDAGETADRGAAVDAVVGADAVVAADGAPPPPDRGVEPDAAGSPDAAEPPDAAPDADQGADAAAPAGCGEGPDPLPGLALRRAGRFLRADAVESAHVRPRGLTIYLPADYDADPARRYPVLYAHDGQNLFDARDAAFGVAWELDDAVDALVAAGTIEPIIVVGVHNTADRIAEYTPSRDAGRQAGGQAAAYGRFLVDELKPALDRRLRTRCGRADTALIGSSLGGLVSFWLLGEYPEVFGRVAAVSPSLWWNDREALGRVARTAAAVHPDTRLWIDAGSEEGGDPDRDGRRSVVEDSRALVEGLVAAGLRFPNQIGYLEDPGAAHDETAWQGRAPFILAWLFGDDPGPPGDFRAEVHSPPLQGVGVPVSVHARWLTWALTLPHGEAEWQGPVADGLLTAAAGADRLLVRWRGREAAVRVDAPVAARVELEVRVPAGSPPPIAIVGSLPAIGDWDPAGRELAHLGGDRYGATLPLPAGVAFEFKITRGSWDTVEKGPQGQELQNRQAVAADGPLVVDVARWADQR
ncbi:MAG: alpha/beta hydrolase-fold protein [bacterium]